jgi:hypothetical protein
MAQKNNAIQSPAYHATIKVAKAKAANARAHMGRKESKTLLAIHLYRTVVR